MRLQIYIYCIHLKPRNGSQLNGSGYANQNGDDLDNDENDDDDDMDDDMDYNDMSMNNASQQRLQHNNTPQKMSSQSASASNSSSRVNTSVAYANRNFNQLNQRKAVVQSPAAATGAVAHAQPLSKRFVSSVQTGAAPSQPTDPYVLLCPYCTYTANVNTSKADYLVHVKDHLCGKTFRCVLCNSVYKYRGDCVVHLKRKHQKADMIAHSYVDKFNLDILDVSDIYSLLKPKQQDEPENEEKLFGCAYCDYKANYKGDVYKHQTRRHPGTMKQVNMLASMYHHSSFNGAGSGSMINQSLNGSTSSNVLANCSNQSSGNSANNSFSNGHGAGGIVDDLAKYNMAMSGGAVNKFYQVRSHFCLLLDERKSQLNSLQ